MLEELTTDEGEEYVPTDDDRMEEDETPVEDKLEELKPDEDESLELEELSADEDTTDDDDDDDTTDDDDRIDEDESLVDDALEDPNVEEDVTLELEELSTDDDDDTIVDELLIDELVIKLLDVLDKLDTTEDEDKCELETEDDVERARLVVDETNEVETEDATETVAGLMIFVS